MTREEWETLVQLVNTHGIIKLEFEYADGYLDVEDITYLQGEDVIVVLLN